MNRSLSSYQNWLLNLKNYGCQFIASKKKDVFVAYENSNVMAFLDYEPINEGHILLISEFSVANAPKTGDVTEKIISAVRNAAAKIRIVDNVLFA